MTFIGTQIRIEELHKRDLTQAWQAEALHRMKELPRKPEILWKEADVQGPEMLVALAKARYEQQETTRKKKKPGGKGHKPLSPKLERRRAALKAARLTNDGRPNR